MCTKDQKYRKILQIVCLLSHVFGECDGYPLQNVTPLSWCLVSFVRKKILGSRKTQGEPHEVSSQVLISTLDWSYLIPAGVRYTATKTRLFVSLQDINVAEFTWKASRSSVLSSWTILCFSLQTYVFKEIRFQNVQISIQRFVCSKLYTFSKTFTGSGRNIGFSIDHYHSAHSKLF